METEFSENATENVKIWLLFLQLFMLTRTAYLSDFCLVWLGMKMLDEEKTPIAEFENLKVVFETKDGTVTGVENISFSIYPGENRLRCPW